MRFPAMIHAEDGPAIDRAALKPPTLLAGASLAEGICLLGASRSGCVLVVDEARRLLGILTRRDLAEAVIDLEGSPRQVPVWRVMQRRVHTVPPNATVRDAAKLMADHEIRRVPIVDARRKLLGLISLSDL
jgi:CBS domain-containing protein